MAFLQGHRRIRVALLVVGGIFATLLAGLLIVGFFVDLGGFVEKALRAQSSKIQEELGRSLRTGRAKLKLLPSVRLELHDIALEAAPGQTGVLAQPLVQLGALRVRVAVGPLLWSFGRRIQVDNLEVSDLRVQIVRTSDGRLSYQDILDKTSTQPEKPPMTQEEIDRLGRILLRHLALTDAAVYFYDLGTPASAATPLRLDNIQFSAEDAQLFEAFPLTLDMAVLSAQRNFHLATTIGPLPRDLQVTQPLSLLRRVEFSLQPIEIEPLLRFLPPSPGVGLGRARIEAQLNLETPAQAGQLELRASAAARGLVLEEAPAGPGKPAQRGQPVDLSVATQLSAALLAGDVKLEKLELSINDMTVSGQADLRSLWTTPSVNKLALSSRGLLLERLFAALPPTAVPEGAVLRGPLVVRGAASGSPAAAQVEVALDLTPATLRFPFLNKPADTPLLLELRGKVKGQGQGADIDRFGLTLGPLALFLTGQVRSADDLDLKLDTGKVDLDRLLRLLPSVERSIEKSGNVDGDLRVSGTIRKQRDTLDASARVTMAKARVDQGDITLRGDAALAADVHSTPQSASVKADLDLTSAQLRVPGSVDKGSGVPMRLRAQIERSGQNINVRLAQLTLPGGDLRLVGHIDQGRNQLDLKVPPVDLDLSQLARVLPALRKGTAGGLLDSRLKIGVSFDGNPNKLGGARASLDQFEMAVAGGSLKGSAEVVGLDEPRKLTFNFVGDRLDLDRIVGKSGDDDNGDDRRADRGGPSVPPFVRRLMMNGRVQVDSGRYKGTAVRDVLLELTMANGKLLVKTMRGQALGGNISASGTTVDFGPSRPRFSVRAKLERIDIGAMAQRDDSSKKLSGRGSLDLSADGQGLAWSEIAPRLTGQLALGLSEGRIQNAGLGGQIVNPLLGQLGQKLAHATNTERDLILRDLNAQLRIEGGRVHTNSPVRVATEEGSLSLSGSVGLDKTLGLTGNFDLAPQAVSKATGGRVAPDVPIPIAVRIGGTISSPTIEMLDVPRSISLLTAAILRGRGKELLSGHGKLPSSLIPALGGQPATGAPPSTTPPSTTPPPAAPIDNARQRLEEVRKSGLGGLFGR